jgi:hypothetical protein
MSNEQNKTKEDFAVEYIKSLKAVEDEIEPYLEFKRDLRKNYIENGWLTRGELWSAVKAYRIIQNDGNMDQLVDMYEKIRTSGVA